MQTETKDVRAEVQLKGIELLKSSVNAPADPNSPLTNFGFSFNLESRIEPGKKLIFMIVSVETIEEESKTTVGSISVSCIYEVVNFEEAIKLGKDNKYEIPTDLIELLNSTSISTTRGIMFSIFKGTFLHNALLPLVNVKQLKPAR